MSSFAYEIHVAKDRQTFERKVREIVTFILTNSSVVILLVVKVASADLKDDVLLLTFDTIFIYDCRLAS